MLPHNVNLLPYLADDLVYHQRDFSCLLAVEVCCNGSQFHLLVSKAPQKGDVGPGILQFMAHDG